MIPPKKDSRCVIPAIWGIISPPARMMIMYMVFVRVGACVKLMPIIANTTPDAPTIGTGEAQMKDTDTVMK